MATGAAPVSLRQAQQVRHDRGLLRQAVIHDLDVEVALAEDLLVLEERPLGRVEVAARQGARDLPLRQPERPIRPFRVLPQERLVHAGPVIEARQVGLGDEPDEVLVALLRRGEDRQVVGVALARLARRLGFAVPAIRRRDVRLDADDRPDAVLQRLVVEGERPEHVAVVGDGDRGHAELRHALAELRQAVGAVEERVLTVKVKVDEVAGHRV